MFSKTGVAAAATCGTGLSAQIAKVKPAKAFLRLVTRGGETANAPQLSSMIDDEQGKWIVCPAVTSNPEFLKRAEALDLPVNPQVGGNAASSVKNASDRRHGMIGCTKQTIKKDQPHFA